LAARRDARPAGPPRGSGGPASFAAARGATAAAEGHFDVEVRARPGASRTAVGGRYGDGDVLVVAVTAPAVDGRATDAVVAALAEAFGVRRADAELVSGATSRSKRVRVRGDATALRARLTELLGP